MTEVNLFDAWKAWIKCTSIQDSYLWGIKIIWWGRLGKIAQFLGGMTILVDIIGTDRVKDYAQSLKHMIDLQKYKQRIKNTYMQIYANVRLLIYRKHVVRAHYIKNYFVDVSKVVEDYEKYNKSHGLPINMLTTTILGYIAWRCLNYFHINLIYSQELFINILLATCFYCICVSYVTPTIILLFFSMCTGLLSIINFFVLGIVKLLEHKRFEAHVKIASIITVFIGTYFDLLAS